MATRARILHSGVVCISEISGRSCVRHCPWAAVVFGIAIGSHVQESSDKHRQANASRKSRRCAWGKQVQCSSPAWISPKRNPSALEILFVRHGESENNVTMARVKKEHRILGSDRQTTQAAWLSERKDDPGLTEQGLVQAKAFASVYAKGLQDRGCIIFSSPFLRTLQTAEPLASFVKCEVIVNKSLFEVGGVYTLSSKGTRGGPGKCLSADEISTSFQGFDVSSLPLAGQWYVEGWETDQQGRSRCEAVATWLRSDELRKHLDGRIMVIVCHGHFIDMLMKALLGSPDDPASDRLDANNFSNRALFFAAENTSTSHVIIKDNGNLVVRSFGDVSHLRVSATGSLGSSVVGG